MSLPRLFVIGDSISMHYGPCLESCIRSYWSYARKTGDEPALQGLEQAGNANGGDSSRVLEYLEVMCGAHALQAEVLLLNCGLHDIRTDPATGARQVPLPQYAKNLERIIALAREAARQVVWVRTTPVDDAMHNSGRDFHRYNQDVETYNAAADAIMQAAGIPIVDLYTFTRNLPGDDIFSDGVHFRPSTCALQAAFVAGYLGNLDRREMPVKVAR